MLYNQKYELWVAKDRDTVDLRNYEQVIKNVLHTVFLGCIKEITVGKYFYSYSLTIKPTKRNLQRVGRLISCNSLELRECIKEGKTSRNLFRNVYKNYDF